MNETHVFNDREYFFTDDKKYWRPGMAGIVTVISNGYYVQIAKQFLGHTKNGIFSFFPTLERLYDRSVELNRTLKQLEGLIESAKKTIPLQPPFSFTCDGGMRDANGKRLNQRTNP